MRWLEILLVLVVLGVIRIFLDYLKERRFQQFAAENGCKPPHREVTKLPWGIDRFYNMMKVIRQGGHLLDDVVVKRFQEERVMSRESVGMLGKMVFNTIEPKNIQAVMALNFKDYEIGKIRNGSFMPLLGNNIFTSDGPSWEHSRALLRPQFARENINDLASAEYNVQALFKVIPVDASGWTPEVDLQEHFFRLTLDGATEFFFNDNVNSQLAAAGMAPVSSNAATNLAADKGGDHMGFAEAFNIAQEWMVFRFRLQGFYWAGDAPSFRRAIKNVQRFVDAAIENVLSSGKSHKTKSGYSLVGSLSQETQNVTEIRDECLGLLLAGRDTTAALLGWLFTAFILYPHIFQKLRAVILEEFDSRDPSEITFAKLKGCRYLQFVINETLRLYTPVPLNARVALRNTILPVGGGLDETAPVAIRKGQGVFFSPYAMHRRADIWGPDVMEFKPERWEGRKSDWAFLPFSGGPRICLGQQYALCEASYVVVRMLQQFDRIESAVPNPKVVPGFTLTYFPGNGVKVRMHRATG
ncbi:MAG: hypothetical protein Q9165_002890 [Trypethelium subeluteriae]